MEKIKKRAVVFIAVCGILITALLVLGTMWMGSVLKKDTEKAVS